MEEKIILGGSEYKYKINFQLSYAFLKYRNRIENGFDIVNANEKILDEIAKAQEKVEEMQKNGQKLNDYEFLKELSPEARLFLENNQKHDYELFSQDEIVDIVSKLTKINDEETLYNILDEEIKYNGFDKLIGKIINAVAKVFTSAKDNSQQKANNKEELVKVAEK